MAEAAGQKGSQYSQGIVKYRWDQANNYTYIEVDIYIKKNGNLVSLSKGGFTNLEQENAYKYSEMLDWNLLHQYKLTILKYI